MMQPLKPSNRPPGNYCCCCGDRIVIVNPWWACQARSINGSLMGYVCDPCAEEIEGEGGDKIHGTT